MSEEEVRKVVELDMESLGETSRRMLMGFFLESIMRPSPLYEHLMANMPPDTRTPWERSRDAMDRFYEDFRISLSKRIYDWSDYEDGCY